MSDTEGIWCLVANVAPYQEFGPEREIRLGTKHFSPNTKVYCFPPLWGDGYENVQAIGRHRGSSRLITVIMPSKRLTNWRAKVVYHPLIVEKMSDCPWREEDVKAMAASLVLWEAARRYKRQGLDFAPPDAALVYASLYGIPDEVQRALERYADIDAMVDGWTPLTAATVWGNPQTVELLLARGASPAKPNANGLTAHDLAKERHRDELASLLSRAESGRFMSILRGWCEAMQEDDS